MLSDDQIRKRKTGIGSSDIAAVMGMSPFGSPYTVWLDKTGQSEVQAPTIPMRRGNALEPIIGQLYEEQIGCTLIPGDTVVGKSPWEIATPDFLSGEKIVEAKAPAYRHGWGDAGTDDVPAHYILQVQWQLGVVQKYESADIAALLGNDLLIYHIRYDDELFRHMQKCAMTFWHDNVMGGKQPEIDGSECTENHLRDRYTHNNGTMIAPTPESMQCINRLREIRATIGELEKEEKLYKNRIIETIGPNDGIDGHVSYKRTKDSSVTSWKDIVAELNPPNCIIEKHTITKPGARRFLLKGDTNE